MSAAPVGPYLPNSSLVVQAWLGQRVPGIVAGQVSTRLPRELTAWAAEGFVQVTIIPTPAEVDIPVRHAFAQIDAWAVALSPDGSVAAKPPVNLAWRLANLIARATEDDTQRLGGFGRQVTLPVDYVPARVQAAYLMTEPSEVPDDPAGYARVTLDLALDWARI